MGIQANRLESLAPGTYIVAVSGGVDSVVLLDILSQQKNTSLIVAHFDHGIRDDSADDAVFVTELAQKYDLTVVTKREELGKHASEELARTRRYAFLRMVAAENDAKIITAHHADDVIETIAINLIRGTGWRGLAVLDSEVIRPLLDFDKMEIIAYAKEHTLLWHEDSTNASNAYLRNRVRTELSDMNQDTKRQLLGLRAQQVGIKQGIEREVASLLVREELAYSRYFYTHIDEISALELLRAVFHEKLTRPQLHQAWLAIKTSKHDKAYEAGNGVTIYFTSRNFTVKLIK